MKYAGYTKEEKTSYNNWLALSKVQERITKRRKELGIVL